ncbi:MAG: ykoU [Gammaproteobacteria bacterium]|jgi:bifunctional non-homologous end joining protein LigD|nr:ykoU [Gammaproteobacteria bacterium]
MKELELSHPDKIMYPKAKVTKLELAEYYHRHIDLILPHLINRPLAILRCPQGQDHPCFYQKHPDTLAKSISSVEIKEKDGQKRPTMLIKKEQDLIHLLQFGALELHTWGSLADNIDKPDRMVFDLDPGPHVEFTAIIEAAKVLKAGLEELNLQSFVKTSGKKGLHIFVPLKRVHDWETVKVFSKNMADQMAEIASNKFVSTISKAKREGKILIDYLRNERGATCVAAYSTRATDSASISVPLSWDELDSIEASNVFDLANIEPRLNKNDPWADYFRIKQTIKSFN